MPLGKKPTTALPKVRRDKQKFKIPHKLFFLEKKHIFATEQNKRKRAFSLFCKPSGRPVGKERGTLQMLTFKNNTLL